MTFLEKYTKFPRRRIQEPRFARAFTALVYPLVANLGIDSRQYKVQNRFVCENKKRNVE